MSRRNTIIGLGAVLALLVSGVAALVVRQVFFAPHTITAYFSSVTAIYPGDDVRVSGIKVGTIRSVQPQGTEVKMTLRVDRNVPIPADARAVIIAQNLVASRYVQLAPAYRTSGPTMPDKAVIPLERTAVPVEWDDVKTQLNRLASELGANGETSQPSVVRFIDTAADALGDNGGKLRQTLAELSGVGRVLADGSGDLVDIIKNMQTLVTVLHSSNTQMVQFNQRFASLASVVDGSRSDLDATLNNLSVAVGEIQRFIAGSRNQTSEQVQRLTDLTQVLADNKMSLKNILHVSANAIANGYSDYNPDTGAVRGGFNMPNFSNPVNAMCSNVGSIENVTAVETGKLCALYAGPGLRVANPLLFANLNFIPIPINPFLSPSADPQNIVYTEDRLAPGGEGPRPGPPELPPAVSAYSGLPGDVPDAPPLPGPPGRIPGAAMPEPPAPTRPGESPPPPVPPLPAEAPGAPGSEGTQP